MAHCAEVKTGLIQWQYVIWRYPRIQGNVGSFGADPTSFNVEFGLPRDGASALGYCWTTYLVSKILSFQVPEAKLWAIQNRFWKYNKDTLLVLNF